MNNEQFRRLVGSSSSSGQSGAQKNGASPKSSSPSGAGGSALGSRMRSSIPMTPRSVGGGRAEFARQLAARNLVNKPQKQYKTSTPKGSRLAEGYIDRSKALGEQEENEQLERIKALAELLQEGKIDQETFDKQRNNIASGDLSSTHLVKGLDFKLLERIRRGEDVYGDKAEEKQEDEPSEDVDDEFERLEEKEVQAVEKQKTEKKGQLAAAALVPGKKRTRDQIIAEMKAAREAAKAQAAEDSLGDRFRKIGAKQKAGSRIERDAKGREVLIIVDEDGHEKRKVRKVNPHQAEDEARQREAFKPDESAKPLGMEVPEIYKKQQVAEEEEDDDDIFADAGDDYDPLAGISDSDEDEDGKEGDKTADKDGAAPEKDAMPPPPKPAKAVNYFEGSKTELLSSRVHKAPSMADPSLQAAFKKAAQLGAKERADGEDEEDDEEARKRKEKHRKMLEAANRDDEDLDMGFGTSRFEDEEDFDETKVKLSQWGDDDDGEGDSKGGKAKRKRGPKKRKGDVNSAADVLRVMEQRKQS